MPPEVIADATCIIALHRIGRIDILKILYSEVAIPPAIEREIHDISKDWIITQEVRKSEVARSLRIYLDEGESEAIAMALDKRDPLFISDDKKARKAARQFGIAVTGTIGVLVRAAREGKTTDLKMILDDLRRTGFHMTEELRKKALEMAGK